MDFPEISILSDFEAGVKCLQDPSLVSRFQVYSYWKWGALILAFVATFSSIIRKIKFLVLFIYVRAIKPSAESLSQHLADSETFHLSDEDDDDDELERSSVSSIDDDIEPRTSCWNQRPVDEDFRVAGSSSFLAEQWHQNGNLRLRRRRNSFERFTWSDSTAGKGVVKLWDSFALGLEFDDSSDSENVVSIWDVNKDKKVNSFSAGVSGLSAVAVSSPAVVLSAAVDDKRNGLVLGAYDRRMGRQMAAICAEWASQAAKVVGVTATSGEKVYVRDDVNGVVTVGDMRNVKTPLKRVMDGDGDDTWWDADAVIVEDEFLDESA